MFSYRHAFHAGNHADVLKHICLLSICNYMVLKEKPITYIDTHAGTGLYPLSDPMSLKSKEYVDGIEKLWLERKSLTAKREGFEILRQYLQMVSGMQTTSGELAWYPGSPFIASRALREIDRIKLFESHPTDSKVLHNRISQLQIPNCFDEKRMTYFVGDGFESLKSLLPPPSRRALVLIDPSYELKEDYSRVAKTMKDALVRFVTGTYVIWYPILARPESQNLPVQLQRLAEKSGTKWLNVTLAVDQIQPTRMSAGLKASGVFVFNPPFTLAQQLQAIMPTLTDALSQSKLSRFSVDSKL